MPKKGPRQKPRPSKAVRDLVKATKAKKASKRARGDVNQGAARIVRDATGD